MLGLEWTDKENKCILDARLNSKLSLRKQKVESSIKEKRTLRVSKECIPDETVTNVSIEDNINMSVSLLELDAFYAEKNVSIQNMDMKLCMAHLDKISDLNFELACSFLVTISKRDEFPIGKMNTILYRVIPFISNSIATLIQHKKDLTDFRIRRLSEILNHFTFTTLNNTHKMLTCNVFTDMFQLRPVITSMMFILSDTMMTTKHISAATDILNDFYLILGNICLENIEIMKRFINLVTLEGVHDIILQTFKYKLYIKFEDLFASICYFLYTIYKDAQDNYYSQLNGNLKFKQLISLIMEEMRCDYYISCENDFKYISHFASIITDAEKSKVCLRMLDYNEVLATINYFLKFKQHNIMRLSSRLLKNVISNLAQEGEEVLIESFITELLQGGNQILLSIGNLSFAYQYKSLLSSQEQELKNADLRDTEITISQTLEFILHLIERSNTSQIAYFLDSDIIEILVTNLDSKRSLKDNELILRIFLEILHKGKAKILSKRTSNFSLFFRCRIGDLINPESKDSFNTVIAVFWIDITCYALNYEKQMKRIDELVKVIQEEGLDHILNELEFFNNIELAEQASSLRQQFFSEEDFLYDTQRKESVDF